MRGIDYRRKQEAKHYKKRLGTAVSIGRFSSAETGYIPQYAGKNNMYRINSSVPLNDYEKKVIENKNISVGSFN